MDRFFDILMWTVLIAALVAILRYGKSSEGIIATFGKFWTSETSILAGK